MTERFSASAYFSETGGAFFEPTSPAAAASKRSVVSGVFSISPRLAGRRLGRTRLVAGPNRSPMCGGAVTTNTEQTQLGIGFFPILRREGERLGTRTRVFTRPKPNQRLSFPATIHCPREAAA